MPPFKLEAPFKPCGHQPEAIAKLAAGVEAGKKHQVLLGVTGSGKTFTMAKVVEGVRPSLPNVKVDPSHISQVLRQDLNLRFLRYDSAMVRYQDPTFDHKRLWVSRLLSQFLLDGALIISIDESHIRHDSRKQYQW